MVEDSESGCRIVSGYQFAEIDRLALRRERARMFASGLRLKGTVVIAPEGVNFSLAGTAGGLDRWLKWVAAELGCDRSVLNRQRVDEPPFLRLKVRVRDEIVTFGGAVQPGRDARGTRVSPAEWNRLIRHADVQLVDTRNDYEYRLGTFERAENPGTTTFMEFREYCRDHLDRDRPVAMFCTGGVRCEKASAWLRSIGFGEVFQLYGGILGYLSETRPVDSLWRGECFVFDDRISLDQALRPTGRVVCRGCRKPAEGLDAAGIPPIHQAATAGECRLCGEVFDRARLNGLRERARQVALTGARGCAHLGPDAQLR